MGSVSYLTAGRLCWPVQLWQLALSLLLISLAEGATRLSVTKCCKGGAAKAGAGRQGQRAFERG